MKRNIVISTIALAAVLISLSFISYDQQGDKALVINPSEFQESVRIILKSSDQMQYDQTELRVKAGQQITLILAHTGKFDKSVMGHNFVLLKMGTDIDEFAKLALAAKDTGYIPESDAIIANTDLIGGGQSTTITFEAPAAGTYDYICSFPGHYTLMKGKLIVE